MRDATSATEEAYNELVASGSPQEPDASESEPEVVASTPPASATQTQDATTTATDSPAAEDEPLTGNIPVSRHKQILEKTRAELSDKLTKLAWAEKYDQSDIDLKVQAMELAERNPQEFLRRYNAVLQQAGLAPAAATPAKEPDQSPDPDVQLSDGSWVYSHSQQQKLMDFRDRQILERIKPFEDERKHRQNVNEAVGRASQMFQRAQAWDGFKENQAAIAQAFEAGLRRDAGYTIHDAYRDVVTPKMKGDVEKIRSETRAAVLAELQSKTSVSSTRPGQAPVIAKDGPRRDAKGKFRSPGEIARQAFEELRDK